MDRKSSFNSYELNKKFDESRPKKLVWKRMYSEIDNFAVVVEDNITRIIHKYGMISGISL